MASIFGCETIPPTRVDRYSTNPRVIEALKLHEYKNVDVEIIKSDALGISEVRCLSEEIGLPDDETYTSYVRTALISELGNDGRFSSNGAVTLRIVLKQVNLDFVGRIGFGARGGIWSFIVTVESSNGVSLTVDSSHSYNTGWAPIRCHTAAQELMPAVQRLMYELVSHDQFPMLLRLSPR